MQNLYNSSRMNVILSRFISIRLLEDIMKKLTKAFRALLALSVLTILLCPAPAQAATTRYVWTSSPSPGPPYGDWATAAHKIQDAVDAATAGDTVLVTNGVYSTGGKAVLPLMTNRVAIDKAIKVLSTNGPNFTVIQGAQAPGGGNGNGAIRCVYLKNGAMLSGFTLTSGATRTLAEGGSPLLSDGGAVCCESTSALVTNCVLTGNSADNAGGGAYLGTLNNCTLTGNSTWSGDGGGMSGGTLNNCTLTSNSAGNGGGAHSSTLNNCILTSNSAEFQGGGAGASTLSNCTLTGNSARGISRAGGGAYWSTLDNCTLTGNSASSADGGGASYSTLNNCTLTGNSVNRAYLGGGGASQSTLNNCTLTGNSAWWGGGVSGGTLNNCIVYYNTAIMSGPNYTNGTFNYCCTTPLPANGNITKAPLFVDLAGGNLRLQSNSPCINAGNNAYATNSTDLDGRPRIVGGTVDMGAYEFQTNASGAFIVWLQQYGLPTNGSADSVDSDHDGLNNWQEWVADTSPTNAASCLRLTILSNTPPVAVTLSSSAARLYTLLCSTNLTTTPPGSVWTPVPGQTDMPGSGDVLTLTDPNPPAPAFYRVSVKLR